MSGGPIPVLFGLPKPVTSSEPRFLSPTLPAPKLPFLAPSHCLYGSWRPPAAPHACLALGVEPKECGVTMVDGIFEQVSLCFLSISSSQPGNGVTKLLSPQRLGQPGPPPKPSAVPSR